MDVDKDESEPENIKPLKEMIINEKEKPAKKQKVKQDVELILPESKFKDAGDIPMSSSDASKLLLVLET